MADNGIPDLGLLRKQAEQRKEDEAAADASVSELRSEADADPIEQMQASIAPQLAAMLGSFFNPQPFGYVISKGELYGHPCLYITFETSHGRQAYPLSPQEAAEMGKKLMRESTGIVLAGAGSVPGT